MKEELLKDITNSIQEKLGEEGSSIIADDIGKLITANTQTIDEINKMNTRIHTLEDTNQKLVSANGSLLQQIPMASEYDKHQSKDEPKEEVKSFNFKSMFDKNGRFKSDI